MCSNSSVSSSADGNSDVYGVMVKIKCKRGQSPLLPLRQKKINLLTTWRVRDDTTALNSSYIDGQYCPTTVGNISDGAKGHS